MGVAKANLVRVGAVGRNETLLQTFPNSRKRGRGQTRSSTEKCRTFHGTVFHWSQAVSLYRDHLNYYRKKIFEFAV
jgi:hypothetical protein